MRIDIYTKAVLTVIAGCLVWLCVALTAVGTPLQAQTRAQAKTPTLVAIVGWVDASGNEHRFANESWPRPTAGLPVMMRATAVAATSEPTTPPAVAPTSAP